MSFAHEYTFPVFVSNGSVLSSGHSADLIPSQLAVFYEKDHTVVQGTPTKWDALKIIQGSLHTKDKLGMYYGGLKKSDESPAFLVSDILEFRKSMPRKAVSEEWTLGWDTVDNSKNIVFECGKKEYRLKIKVWGEDVYSTYLRPVEREVGISTDCCPGTANCDETCDDAVAGKKYVKLLAEKINNDPELKWFVHAEALFSDAVSNTATHRLYTLRVPDDGTQMALAAVQVAVGTSFKVEKIGREGIESIYQVVTVLSGGSPVATPSAFTPSKPIKLADCDTCPTSYTLVPGTDTYTVIRPLAGDEDLTDNTAKQTYADTLLADYITATTFNGATAVEVVAASDAITLTGHSFVTGEKVLYEDGGGTQIVGLTDGSEYFVIKVNANTIKLATTAANAFAGTAIAISDGVGAAHTLTPVVDAVFVSNDSSAATVSFKVIAGKSGITAVDADSVTMTSREVSLCTPPAGSSINWVAGEDRYKTTRTLKLTLNKDCGSGNRLADLVAFYANNPDVAVAPSISTAGDCSDIYTITQYNKELLEDGCKTEGVPTFDELPAFEGFRWVPDAAAEGATNVKVGLRITTAYSSTKFGNCSFHPNDYYSVRPLLLEVTQIDNSGKPCESQFPSRKTRYASMPTQSGEFVIREFIKAYKYRVNGEYFVDPRLREVMDSIAQDAIDRFTTYVIYYFKVRAHRPAVNHTADFSPEIYEFQIFAPVGTDMADVENALSKVSSLNGVYLQVK